MPFTSGDAAFSKSLRTLVTALRVFMCMHFILLLFYAAVSRDKSMITMMIIGLIIC